MNLDEIVTWKGVRLEDMEKPELIAALKFMAKKEKERLERNRVRPEQFSR